MILLRHGQTVFNAVFTETRVDPGVPDPPLTDLGRDQACEAAERLRGENVRRLVASPYLRALETAEIIAAELDIPVTVEALVRERMAFSCDVGSPRTALAERWPGWRFEHVDEIWWHTEEEPVESLFDRCRAFCAEMASAPDWRDVGVVTHWGVIRALTGQRVLNGEIIRVDPATVEIPHPEADQAP
jgi:broad specificity phosphatase PhoE